MVAPTVQDAFEDVSIEVPVSTEFETIPAGVYSARLIGFTTCDKPDWALKGEEDEDKQQWKWTLEITDGDYAGTRLTEYTNRTWHEKGKAHRHAAALLNLPMLPVNQTGSTKQLANKPCQIWVVEKPTKKDPSVYRNYVDKILPVPAPRQRPTRAPQPLQATTTPDPAVTLPKGTYNEEAALWDDILPEA